MEGFFLSLSIVSVRAALIYSSLIEGFLVGGWGGGVHIRVSGLFMPSKTLQNFCFGLFEGGGKDWLLFHGAFPLINLNTSRSVMAGERGEGVISA